jgi:tRNA(Ile)-lysidine synthase
VAGPFLRPFLGLEKAELLAYLEEKRLPFSTDSTNASTDYLRNKIRRELVPFLDRGFPGWRSGLDRASAKARRDDEALEVASLALRFDPSPSGGLCVSSSDLFAAPEAVALRALVEAGGRLLGKGRFPSDLALEALRVLGREAVSSYSGAGFVFTRREERVELRYGLDFPRVRGYFILIDRPRRVRVGSIELRAEWREASLGADCGPGIRADAFCFPLVVRSRRPGDSISLPGGTKRLDELFSEWALPEEVRARVPVIEDRGGIVAVFGSSVGKKDRYRVGPNGRCDCCLSVIVKGA